MDYEVERESSSVIIDGFEIVNAARSTEDDVLSITDIKLDCDSEETISHIAKAARLSEQSGGSNSHHADRNPSVEMQQLLKQWELEELSERFALNLIDVSILDYILEVDILELCKDLPLRYRIVLRHKLNEKNFTPTVPVPEPVQQESTERRRKKAVPRAHQSRVDQESPDQEVQQSPSSAKAREESKLDVSSGSSKFDAAHLEPKFTKPDFNLIDVCTHYEPGSSFLQSYKIENGKRIYPAESRQYIKKAMVEHFFRRGKGHISTYDFQLMVQMITDELPDENPSIWYVMPNGIKQARGMLHCRYRYLQQIDTRYKKTKVQRTSSVPYSDILTERATQYWNGLSTVEQEGCFVAKQQLRTLSNGDIQEISDNWQACFPLRRYEAVTGTLRLEEWNSLSGCKNINDLFSYDFYSIHLMEPKTVNDRMAYFIERFKSIHPSYKALLEADKALAQAVSDVVLNSVEITDHAVFLVLYSLSLMIRQEFCTKDKKRTKMKREDSRMAFMLLLESNDNITEAIEKRKRTTLEKGQTLTPFVIAKGSVKHGISKYYVATDSLMYDCQSAAQAVDLMMKLYTVLHMKFNDKCEYILTFIQSFFYEQVDDTTVIPTVTAFLTDIDRL